MTRRLGLLVPLSFALVACASPAPSGPAPANASQADGRYTLQLELPKATWAPGEGITGNAALVVEPGPDADVSGSGGLLGFSFSEVGGARVMGPAFNSDCAVHRLSAAHPLETPLAKSGGWGSDLPDADFYRQFFTQPGIHLPAGDWDVAVVTEFFDGRGCDGAKHDLKSTVRIHVTDGPSPSVQP